MKRPGPCEYRRSVEIDAPVEQVFAFHANPANIPEISPRWQSVRVIRASLARVGDEFEIEVRLLGLLTLRWRGIWREVTAPAWLVDEALQSPFAFFQQKHRFEPLDGGRTLLTDHIVYRFPGGWAGKLLGETIGRVQFALMFTDRQRRTRRRLQAHAAPSFTR